MRREDRDGPAESAGRNVLSGATFWGTIASGRLVAIGEGLIIDGVEPDRAAPASSPVSVGELYDSTYDGLVRVAFLLLGSDDQAEDVVQEAFSRAIRRWDRIDDPAAYLKWSVVNGCRDAIRRRSIESRYRLRRTPDRDHVAAPQVPLLDALARLSPRQQAVIVMRYYADMREIDVAAVLRCSVATVKSLNRRALAILRKDFPRGIE